MRIIALSTGSVRVKRDMARGRPGPLRRARLFLPGPLGGPRPIHAWVVEHADGLLLVDSGERPGVSDLPFATFDVGPGDDVVSRLRAAGIDPDEIGAIALTHLHGDHMNGVPLLPGRQVLVSAGELRDARGLLGRIEKRVTHQPLPEPFAPTTLTFDGPPIGGFAASQPVTPDGRVIAVPAPGHTPHHVAYLVDEGDHHVLLAGDTTYDQEQLLDRVVDAPSPSAKVSRATIDRVLAHAREQPTVYLPSHDPGSAARLEQREPLRPRGS